MLAALFAQGEQGLHAHADAKVGATFFDETSNGVDEIPFVQVAHCVERRRRRQGR